MKPQAIVGIILVLIGVFILVYQGFSFTHQTQIAKVGPLEVNGKKTENVFISPVIGGVCVVAGIAVFALGARRS